MREAGCRQVLIGLESPEQGPLEGDRAAGELQSRRAPTATPKRLAAIQGHGITVNGCFILGLDGQTPDIFQQVLEFSLEHRCTTCRSRC